ncbi:putative NAD-binding-like protein [Neofusicoccum parvum]|nr:putative NAD-binding-like protein [Neofusicoccum parvum]
MLLPRIVSSTLSPHHPYTSLFDTHLEYCLDSEPWHHAPSAFTSPTASTVFSSDSDSDSDSESNDGPYPDRARLAALTRSARTDLATVNTAFPSLRSAAVVLCMAAWFRLLCRVDDLLERLPACAVERVVSANIDVLRRGCRIGVVKAARPNPLENFAAACSMAGGEGEARARRREAYACGGGGGGAESAWGCYEERGGSGSKRSSSGSSASSGSASRTPSPHYRCEHDRGVEETAGRVRHLTQVFRAHVQSLLPDRVYRRLAAAICNTWAGYIAEASFRESVAACTGSSISRPLLGTYLAVRERTIGVAPFFVLLEADILPPGHVNSAALTALKQNVTDVVVLQNDLCGLERDIGAENVLNFAILASDELRAVVAGKEVRTRSNGRLRGEEFGMTVQEAVQKGNEGILRATALHNNAVEMASQYCEDLVAEMDREDCDEEAVVANEILNFVTTHYRWASKAWTL